MSLPSRYELVLGAAPELSPEGRTAYEEALRELRAHVAQHGAHSGTTVAWDTIETRAAQLLEQVKDVRIACYFVLAQVHRQPVTQSAPALAFLGALIDKHHAQLEPPPARERARATSVTWLHEELKKVWAALPAQPEAWHQQAAAAGAQLDGALRAHWPQPMPSFAAGVAAVPKRIQARPQAEPAVPAPSAPMARESAQRVQAPEPQAAAPCMPSQPLEPLVGFGQSLLQQAEAHLRGSPLHPAALRLRRQGLWFHIQTAPVPLGDVTRIAPVPPAALAKLESLAEGQAWAEAHQLAETLMLQHRLILGLQRRSAEACLALGPEHAGAARAIAAETLGLVARIPELMVARAHDGSPLCDAATQAWLMHAAPKQVVPSTAQRAPLPPSTAARVPAPTAAPNTPRAQFLARMAEAEALDAKGDAALAQAALSALAKGAHATKLAAWEPELLARLYHLELTALGQLPCTERLVGRSAQVLRRLATVDLNLARQLNQPPPKPRSAS